MEYSRTDVFGTLLSVLTHELLHATEFQVKKLRNIKVGVGYHSRSVEIFFSFLIYYFASHGFVNVLLYTPK